LCDDALSVCSRGGRRDLLAQYCAYGELGAVDATRHSASRRLGDHPSKLWIGAKQLIDRCGIGVKVE
jgi:hypothetical protein